MTKFNRPDESALASAAEVLQRLAAEHGLKNLRLAGPGELVVDVTRGRTYFDIVAFESAVEAELGWRPLGVLSSAPSARPTGPLVGPDADPDQATDAARQ